MRFSSAVVLCAVSVSGFQPVAFTRHVAPLHMSAVSSEEKAASKKEDRLRMMKSEQFHRRGFKEVREGVEKTMGEQFQSEIVDELKSKDYVLERDGVKVHLAKVRIDVCCGDRRRNTSKHNTHPLAHKSHSHSHTTRTLAFAGASSAPSPWRTRLWSTSRARRSTSPTNSFTTRKSTRSSGT